MIRETLIIALLAAPAWAGTPDFAKGAVIVGVDYGIGLFTLDRSKLAAQVGQANADTYVNEEQNTNTLSLRLGYNILGHATVEADLTGTGWNLGNSNRGGGGFMAGIAAWHPLQLLMPDPTRAWDASIFGGLGYGIMGQDRGMDGLIGELGARGGYYFTPWLGVEGFVRWVILGFSNFYLDYDHRGDPGNTVQLPQGSGGSFVTLGVAAVLRLIP